MTDDDAVLQPFVRAASADFPNLSIRCACYRPFVHVEDTLELTLQLSVATCASTRVSARLGEWARGLVVVEESSSATKLTFARVFSANNSGLYHFRDTILKGNPDQIFVMHADIACSFVRRAPCRLALLPMHWLRLTAPRRSAHSLWSSSRLSTISTAVSERSWASRCAPFGSGPGVRRSPS